jgi:hypothetical protein
MNSHFRSKTHVNKSGTLPYASYGVAGNLGSFQRVYQSVERYWHKMLSSRSQKAKVWWEVFLAIKRIYPLQRLRLSLPYVRLKQYAVL